MSKSNVETVRQSFTLQAEQFESDQMYFSKQEYLDDIIKRIKVRSSDCVLEVAAGTCACGRSLAALVQLVVCLDTTPAMLSVGQQKAIQADIDNIVFVCGEAENLPFLECSFDVVISRLAFHHFCDPKQAFAEMVRVLKPGGKLVIIDMEAAEESLREKEDNLERLRDPSHVQNYSIAELQSLYQQHDFSIVCSEKTRIPVSAQAWLELTKTPEEKQKTILRQFYEELQHGQKTGFAPYWIADMIYFVQRWVFIIGMKPLEED